MAYYPSTPFVPQFFTDTGVPLSGGTITAIVADTVNTPTNMFIDGAGTSAGPVITLNARGEPQVSGNTVVIWLNDAVTYKFILKDASGISKWTIDDISSAGALLKADLANTSDVAKGDAMIGVKRTSTGAIATTLHAWIERQYFQFADFGAVGDGTTNDTAAITAALAAAAAVGKNNLVIAKGLSGDRFRTDSFTIPEYMGIRGASDTFGMNDVYTADSFNTAGATFLLNSGQTITIDNGSSLRNMHVFPYGMTFPQTGSSAWAGTAITINAGASTNTVDVLLENLLICGFNLAISGYWCPRLICNNVNFDCNNGIKIETAGDPIRFFNCHGWPFATIAGAVVTTVGARDRRSGNGFEFLTNADAGKITNCFAFGYNVGFSQTNANGITYVNCGSDDYNLFGPLTSIGWLISGTCGFTSMIGCQSVAHNYGISLDAADDTNILQVTGGLYSANTTEDFHVLEGTLVLNGATLGAAERAVGLFGATNRLSMDNCVLQGLTDEVVLNNANSPYIYIGKNNITQDITVPMYNGGAVEDSVASANSVSLPMSGDNILVTGTTNIFGFINGWPGRIVHLRFNGVLTLSDSATLQLAGNFTTAANATLSLRFTSAGQCYEVARSTN